MQPRWTTAYSPGLLENNAKGDTGMSDLMTFATYRTAVRQSSSPLNSVVNDPRANGQFI